MEPVVIKKRNSKSLHFIRGFWLDTKRIQNYAIADKKYLGQLP
jgi:hypothetical protein